MKKVIYAVLVFNYFLKSRFICSKMVLIIIFLNYNFCIYIPEEIFLKIN